MIAILSIFLLNLAWPQSLPMTNEEALSFLSADGETHIQTGEYQVENKQTVEIDGISYIQYDLKKSHKISKFYQSDFTLCPVELPGNVALKSIYVTANLASSVLAIYEMRKQTYDKTKHAYAGYFIGNVSSGISQLLIPKYTNNRKLKILLSGIVSSAVVGVGKEYRDSLGYGNVEAVDAVFTIGGGVVGSVTFSLVDLKRK